MNGKPTIFSQTHHYLLAAILSLALFAIYNVNLRASSSVDTLPATLLPVSILKYGDLNLNEFGHLFHPQPDLWRAGFVFGAIQKKDGDIISSYPVGAALIATPIYAAARVTGILQPTKWETYRLTGKLAASILVALSAGILYLSLINVTGTGAALWLAAAYGLGTGAFSTASQGMWQHGPGMFCLSLALLAISRIDRDARHAQLLAFAGGLSLALAVLCRNLNLFPTLAFTAYMLLYQRRLLLSYLAPLACFALWLLQYNYFTYGHLSGGYQAILGSDWHKSRHLTETGLFHHPLLSGLMDTWLSPSKGILIYSPFLIFAFALPFTRQDSTGQAITKQAKHRRLSLFLYLWIAATSLILAKDILWWGGTSFGPRYFLEMSVAMVFLIGLAYPQLPKILKYCLNSLIILSILIHTLGTFYAPCGWAETPSLADFHPQRYWDWSDTEIERCSIRGIKEGPIPPEFSIDLF